MVDIKRSIAGVRLLADTDDKEQAAKVQKILDAVMQTYKQQWKPRSPSEQRLYDKFNSIFGGVL